jgi:hypothetical protein
MRESISTAKETINLLPLGRSEILTYAHCTYYVHAGNILTAKEMHILLPLGEGKATLFPKKA